MTFPASAAETFVAAELERLRKVAGMTTLPPRYIPGSMPRGARIVDVPGQQHGRGTWQLWIESPTEGDGDPVLMETGTAWQCGYCGYRDLCARAGNPAAPIEGGGL